MARDRSSQSGWVWTTTAIALIIATLGAAWGDHVSDSGQTAAANVWFLETDVSGSSRARLIELVQSRADEILSTSVSVSVADQEVSYQAGELGFSYDVDGVVAEILEARHRGGPGQQALDWVSAPISPIGIGDSVEFERLPAEQRLSDDPRLRLADPVEPDVVLGPENVFQAIPGVVGGIVDIDDLLARLAEQDPTNGEISIVAEVIDLPPEGEDEVAAEVAASLNSLTADSVDFLVGSAHASIGSTLLRRHVEIEVENGNFVVDFDADRLHAMLEGLIDEPVTDLVDPTIVIEDGKPVLVAEGEPPLACCDRESVREAAEMIMAGANGPLWIEPRPDDDPNLAAWVSGELITAKVGDFTTNHACCQNRVNNIHRIADIVRGIYLLPGESVSLNEHVGQRTREKGFVPAGAIRSGHLEDEVGGGVSQFATTIFNAAYFAGLDIPVYQAHSLYFSRYPFGREATISHPAPDLVLENVTSYPVLIWTSYTDTSITVEMYSTPNVVVEELGQRVGRWSRCTHVETDRQRTFEDGTVIVDTFEALYRPAEGLDCNGRVIPQR